MNPMMIEVMLIALVMMIGNSLWSSIMLLQMSNRQSCISWKLYAGVRILAHFSRIDLKIKLCLLWSMLRLPLISRMASMLLPTACFMMGL